MESMTELERLIAIQEIKLLKARRDRALDTKDWETYTALHAPDHYSHSDGEERRDGNRANTEFVIKILGEKVTIHHSHTPEITFDSPTSAHGVWAMEDMIFWTAGGKEQSLHGFGHYYETYEQRDGAWLFTSRKLRRIHVDSTAPLV
jgi:hypothetical protein